MKRHALEQLLQASGRENHSEVQWLEQEIKSVTTRGEPMKAENLYHTGIVVDDLEATMEWLTKVAGYTWTDVVSVDQEAVTPDGDVTIPMKMVYSGAEPRLELLQTVAGTVWTSRGLGRAPHRLLVRRRRIRSGRIGIERHDCRGEIVTTPTAPARSCGRTPRAPTGPRIELVSRSMEPFIAYWWETATGK